MIAFGHTAVGVLVGVTTYQLLGSGDLATGLVVTGTAGVVSHYITDFIPHGHFLKSITRKNIVPIIIFDLFLSILLFVGMSLYEYGFNNEFWYILFGIGGAQLPDVLDGLIYIKVFKPVGIVKYEYRFHQFLHWHGIGNNVLLLGKKDLWQLIVVLFASFVILNYS